MENVKTKRKKTIINKSVDNSKSTKRSIKNSTKKTSKKSVKKTTRKKSKSNEKDKINAANIEKTKEKSDNTSIDSKIQSENKITNENIHQKTDLPPLLQQIIEDIELEETTLDETNVKSKKEINRLYDNFKNESDMNETGLNETGMKKIDNVDGDIIDIIKQLKKSNDNTKEITSNTAVNEYIPQLMPVFSNLYEFPRIYIILKLKNYEYTIDFYHIKLGFPILYQSVGEKIIFKCGDSILGFHSDENLSKIMQNENTYPIILQTKTPHPALIQKLEKHGINYVEEQIDEAEKFIIIKDPNDYRLIILGFSQYI